MSVPCDQTHVGWAVSRPASRRPEARVSRQSAAGADGRHPQAERPPNTEHRADDSLPRLLGGRRGAVDASLPPAAFVVAWVVSGESLGIAAAAAVGVAAVIAGWRLRTGTRPRAVLVGLLGVAVAALIALRTGRAADFFLLQVLSNAASALAWAVSIVVRWPLLGVVVGLVLGQRTTWRQDPALLRAYSRASWVWSVQYVLRPLFFVPLWLSGHVVALGVARVVLSWPLIAVSLAVSWLVIRRSLPAGHPGLRTPVVDDAALHRHPDRST